MKKTSAKKEATPVVIKKEISKKMKPAGNVNEALFAFQSENIVLPRNGQGTTNGKSYRYVTLDDMINGIRPFITKHGLAFTQLIQDDKLETVLIHAVSGTQIRSEIRIGLPTSMQDYGGRITYTRRYSLQSLLGLSAEEDTDAAPAGLVGAILNAPGSVQSVNKPVDTVENSAAKNLSNKVISETVGPVRSESFLKAKGAVDTCFDPEAFTLIKGQIERSSRLNETEKAELQTMLKARDTEINGTVHID